MAVRYIRGSRSEPARGEKGAATRRLMVADSERKIRYHLRQIGAHESAILQERLRIRDRQGYGGSIREAGGAFAEREKAKEDQYFYNIQKEQLKRMKDDSRKKVKYHREQIEKHEEAIRMEEEKFKDRQG